MNRKLILPAALLFLVTACNNSADADKKTTDTSAATGHDMNHTAPTGGVPELPAVPEGAKVSFKNLKDGATVSSTFKVEMGADGIKVDTAGPVLAGVGHHHILIDAGDSVATGVVIPMDSLHRHFGKAQTETELKLSPGKHRLTLQFADGLHRSYGAKMATSVTVTVKE
jgi:hypothetical protein